MRSRLEPALLLSSSITAVVPPALFQRATPAVFFAARTHCLDLDPPLGLVNASVDKIDLDCKFCCVFGNAPGLPVARLRRSPTSAPEENVRRRQLLEAAFDVFLKYGFRKTSMDEVARAASVSRQGLYLHFPNKEALFQAVVQHALAQALTAASERLADPALTVRARLLGAFDEWLGRHVGALGAGASDLGEATRLSSAPLLHEYGESFRELLAKFMRGSGLLAAYKPAGLTARQLADTLYATALGLKHECTTRDEFNAGLSRAVRAFLLPLGPRS